MGRMKSGHGARWWGLVKKGFIEEVVFNSLFFFFCIFLKKIF